MSWHYYQDHHTSRGQMVKDLIKTVTTSNGAKYEAIHRSTQSSCLWVVWKYTKLDGSEKTFLTAYLLTQYKGIQGYKSIEAKCSPNRYSCPKYMLAFDSRLDEAWVARVLQHHDKVTEAKNFIRSIKVGDIIGYHSYAKRVKVTSVKPFQGCIKNDPKEYKLKLAWVSPFKYDTL